VEVAREYPTQQSVGLGEVVNEPMTLAEIWERTGAIKFRVRDVNTLCDFFVTSIMRFEAGAPFHMGAYSCTGYLLQRVCMHCDDRKYALLSSPEEIEWLRKRQDQSVIVQLRKKYAAFESKRPLTNPFADNDEVNRIFEEMANV